MCSGRCLRRKGYNGARVTSGRGTEGNGECLCLVSVSVCVCARTQGLGKTRLAEADRKEGRQMRKVRTRVNELGGSGRVRGCASRSDASHRRKCSTQSNLVCVGGGRRWQFGDGG